MGDETINDYKSEKYLIEGKRAKSFAEEFDPNSNHLDSEFISGIYLIALSNASVLKIPFFSKIKLARSLNIEFLHKVPSGVWCETRVHSVQYKDDWILSQCSIFVLGGDSSYPSVIYNISQRF